MPKGPIPYQKTLESYINSSEINFNNMQMGNTAITPELRIYLSLKKMKGFYIAPYAKLQLLTLALE
jgi:hypothetical protein